MMVYCSPDFYKSKNPLHNRVWKKNMIVKNIYMFDPPECVGQRAIVYVNIFFTEQVQSDQMSQSSLLTVPLF